MEISLQATNYWGIFRSTDNGANWTEANSGLPINFRGFCFHGNRGKHLRSYKFRFIGTSGIYLSTDDGTSWSAVNSELPNVSVRSLAISGMTLFAVLEVVLYGVVTIGNDYHSGSSSQLSKEFLLSQNFPIPLTLLQNKILYSTNLPKL